MKDNDKMSKGLSEGKSSTKKNRKTQNNGVQIYEAQINERDIAIIGIACRFPGTDNSNEFRQNLERGMDLITEVPSERWGFDQYYSANPNEPNKSVTKKCGLINNAYSFDNRFFNISPVEAANMDPQQRVFLEEAWRCIEDSGEPLERLRKKKTSVFVGATPLECYFDINTPGLQANYYTAGGSYYFMIANRISYFLGFSGESKMLDTGCSSALVALHDAKLSLITERSDYSIVAGVNMHFSAFKHIAWSKGRIISPDGKCKTFDKDGNGMVPGEGVGVLLLKPLKKALEDNNHIYGVIKGIAVNHGGKASSVSSPRVDAQRDVILTALEDAGISADTVNYVETHGTGTILGDPIEVEGLTRAFRKYTDDNGFCNIGSVKTNIGHTIAAAGIAGVIKVLLMLKAKKIFPSLNVNTINPIIDFEHTPFKVATHLCDWERRTDGTPLRAGVSSFGFGGVNSHVIIEEFNSEDYIKKTRNEDIADLFALSAKSPESFKKMLDEWKRYTNSDEFNADNLGDICFTLLTGRSAFQYRVGKLVNGKEQLKSYLESLDMGAISKISDCKRCVVIGEPGIEGYKKLKQGFDNPIFKSKLEELIKLLEDGKAAKETIEGLYKDEWDKKLKPLYLFMVSYTCLSAITDSGFAPDAVIGKGAGIWTSLTLSGVLKKEDVLMVLAGKKDIGGLKASRPKYLFFDPVNDKYIEPYYFDEGYLRLLMQDIDISNTVLDNYASRARMIYENQYTFKKYIEEWKEAFIEHKLDFIKMLYDDQWINSDSSQFKRQKLLFLLVIMSSMKKLNRKWDLAQERVLDEQRVYELQSLIIDDLISKDVVVKLFLSENPDYKAATDSLNKRIQEFELKGSYDILNRRNAALHEISDIGAWIGAALLKDGIPGAAGMACVLSGEGIPLNCRNAVASFDLQGDFENDYKQFLMDLWLNGVEIKWDSLYAARNCFRLSLPQYAFKREVFKAQLGAPKQESHANKLHPLLDANVSTLKEQRFILKLTGKEFFMSDHVVAGKKTLPGVAYIEMVRAAGDFSDEKKVSKLKNIVWLKPITIEDGEREVYISLYPEDGAVDFEVTAPENKRSNVLCAQGKLVYGSQNNEAGCGSFDLEQLKERCSGYKSKQGCYQLLDDIALNYGEGFRPLAEIYLGQGEAVARLELPSKLENTISNFVLHPVLLDGALQTAVCLAADEDYGQKNLYIPFAMGEVDIVNAIPSKCYAFVCETNISGNQGKGMRTFNIVLLDDRGNVHVRIQDFSVRIVEGPEKQAQAVLAKTIWENRPYLLDKGIHKWSGNVLLLGVPEKLYFDMNKLKDDSSSGSMKLVYVKYGQKFSDQGNGIFTINPGSLEDYEKLLEILESQSLKPEKLIHMCMTTEIKSDSLDKEVEATFYAGFSMMKCLTLRKHENPIKILFFYEESKEGYNPIGAAMEGFSMTVMKENSKLSLKAVGVAKGMQYGNIGPNSLTDILLYEMYETNAVGVRYTASGRQIRVNREVEENNKGATLLKNGGVYLITGGAGGLGLIFAGYLAERFKARVILTGRSQLDNDKKEKLSKLSSEGQIEYIQANITKKNEVERLVSGIKQKYGELNGIIHGAGVISDAYISKKTMNDIAVVLAPKVIGTVCLDNATKDENLDFFVMFSSIVSVLGNPGQCDYTYANSFMDYYALLRESYCAAGIRSGKTLSINWPLWKDGGMKVDDSTRILMGKTIGMTPMSTSTGLKAFEMGLTLGVCSLIVAEGNKHKILNALGIFKEGVTAPVAVQGKLPEVDQQKFLDKLNDELASIVSEILNVPKDEIDLDEDKTEYGFDSININNFVNRVNEKMNLEIIPPVFFEHSTIGSFARFLCEKYREHLIMRYFKESTAQIGTQQSLVQAAPEEPDRAGLQNNINLSLKRILSEILNVASDEIDLNEDKSEYGFDSININDFINRVNDELNLDIIPPIFFEHSTIGSFAQYLADKYSGHLEKCYAHGGVIQTAIEAEHIFKEKNVTDISQRERRRFIEQQTSVMQADSVKHAPDEPIAIVGIGGAMPQSEDLSVFWENMIAGRDMISTIPQDRWDWREYYGDPLKETNKTNVKWGGFMKDADKFDAAFFGISPREAEMMDPQQRIFIETVWSTIEDAGYKPSDLSGTRTGIYVGASTWDYVDCLREQGVEIQAQATTGTCHSIIPNRISYMLNLYGPSIPIDTACSSSLVAVHQAVEALRSGVCDAAIAGGVSVLASPAFYISFSKAGMLCEDGRCKTFDKSANGYVRGEGVGAIYLKPLSKAINDRDHIYAVIRSTSINHGGHSNSMTAPNPVLQARLLSDAWKKSGIDPATVGYIEAHGTGTNLGDPIEINGLKAAFEELYKDWGKCLPDKPHCALGSVKTYIGHLEAAAGIAGLLKTVLAMEHGKLPGNLNFKELNPYIQLEGSPFYILDGTREWERLYDADVGRIPRRAGISAFGFGGANAHVVLEEYCPETETENVSDTGRHVVVLSARNEDRLKAYAKEICEFMSSKSSPVNLRDMAYTLMTGREAMEERLAFTASSLEEVETKLRRYLSNENAVEGLYRNNIKKGIIDFSLVFGGETGQEYIDKVINKRELEKIAQLWVLCAGFNFSAMYSYGRFRHISLPAYPFSRDRFWVPSATKLHQGYERELHPLIRGVDFKQSLKNGITFERTFKQHEHILAHHKVLGKCVLPGVGHLEMAYSTGLKATGAKNVKLSSVVWLKPLEVSNNGEDIEVALRYDNSKLRFEIRNKKDRSNPYSRGEILASANSSGAAGRESLCLEEIKNRSRFMVEKEDFYRQFEEAGIEYGRYFSGVERVWGNIGEALSEIVVPKEFEKELQDYVLHPSIMDASLQTIAGLSERGEMPEFKLKMPFAIEELKFISPLKAKSYVYAKAIGNEKFDVDILDEKGAVCVRLHEVSLRKLNTDTKGFYYTPAWKLSPLKEEKGFGAVENCSASGCTLLVFCSPHAAGLSEAISEMHSGDNVFTVQLGNVNKMHSEHYRKIKTGDAQALDNLVGAIGDISNIYFLGGIQDPGMDGEDLRQLEQSQEMGVMSLFRLVKALGLHGYGSRVISLKVVTSDIYRILPDDSVMPLGASVVGLAKTLDKEYPEWKIKLIDVSSKDIYKKNEMLTETAHAIVMEPLEAKDKEMALRGDRRYLKLLEPVRLSAAKDSLFKNSGVYVILGGAGGIGIELGMHLAKTCKANLALIGRSQLDAAKMERINMIEASGSKVVYLRADANDFQSIKAAVTKVKEHFGSIDGVIHSAIVLKDRLISNMDEDAFRKALDPKITGSVNLYKAVQDENPDFIMFFSSAQSFFGNAGQSNYVAGCTFKDAFGHYIEQKGRLKAKIINWGYWGSVGIVSSEEYNKKLQALGIESIMPREGMEVVENTLASQLTQVVSIKARKEFLESIGVDLTHKNQVYPLTIPSIMNSAFDMGAQPVMDGDNLSTLKSAFEELEIFINSALLRTFQSMGVFRAPGAAYEKQKLIKDMRLESKYIKLFDALLCIAERAGFISIDRNRILTENLVDDSKVKDYMESLEKKKDYILNTYPVIKDYVKLLWVCINRYPDILSGKVPATDVLFPNSSMELLSGIYKGNIIADYYNSLLVWSVLSYIKARIPDLSGGEKIRILEVGAGTGGTSALVFDAIRSFGENLTYTYTDISMALVLHGRQHYGSLNPYSEFKVLDIEKDVLGQGYVSGDYDIIIGTNVLHATRDIRKTLRSIKLLLKTNGWIVVNEVTRVHDVATMIFGLLDGWWLYGDEENRMTGSPLLNTKTWETILFEEGFDRIAVLGQPGSGEKELKQNVIVAESNGVVGSSFKEPLSVGVMSGAGAKTAAEVQRQKSPVKQAAKKADETKPSRLVLSADELAERKRRFVEGKIISILADVLKVSEDEFDFDSAYTDFGVDSILAIEIADRLNNDLQINLRSTDLFNYATITKLTDYIISRFAEEIDGLDNDMQGDSDEEEAEENEVEQEIGQIGGADSIELVLSRLRDGGLDVDDAVKMLMEGGQVR